MDRAERERRYSSLAAAWSLQTIAEMLCDLEETYAAVVKERDAARAEATRYRGLLQGVVRGDKDMCECEGECFFCGGWVQDMGYEGHAADCPWIAAVVALAATEPDEP